MLINGVQVDILQYDMITQYNRNIVCNDNKNINDVILAMPLHLVIE